MVVNLKMRLGQGARRRSSPAGAGAAGERCERAPPGPPHPRPGAAPLGRDPGAGPCAAERAEPVAPKEWAGSRRLCCAPAVNGPRPSARK